MFVFIPGMKQGYPHLPLTQYDSKLFRHCNDARIGNERHID